MKGKYNITNKFFKMIITLVIVVMSTLMFGNMANANFEPPTNFISKKTNLGIMPIYYNGKWYYCQDRGLILRTGKFDDYRYHIEDFPGIEADLIDVAMFHDYDYIVDVFKKNAMRDAKSQIPNGAYNIRYYNYNYNPIPVTRPIDRTKKAFMIAWSDDSDSTGMIIQHIIGAGKKMAREIMIRLHVIEEKSDDYSDDIDPENPINDPNCDEAEKSIVVVEDGKGNPGYIENGPITITNETNSYILSGTVFKNDVKRSWGYTEEDIQVAYWMHNDRSGWLQGPENLGISESAMQTGRKLYAEALAYQKWLDAGNSSNYQTSMSNDDAQVFVNRRDGARNQDEYIIGPISINYPSAKSYEDATYSLPEKAHFSYITDLKITTDTGASLSYRNGDFQIYSNRMGKCSGNMTYSDATVYPDTKYCPENGEGVYIILNASKANYPKKITIQAEFEYVTKTEASYVDLRGEAVAYKYKGHVLQEMVMYTVNASYSQRVFSHYAKDSKGNDYPVYKTVHGEVLGRSQGRIGQVYVDMYKDDYGHNKNIDTTLDPQPLLRLISAGVDLAQASTTIDIDLTMEMGGTVWVDGRNGKESELNGKYDVDSLGNPLTRNENGEEITDPDKPMSGITVKLHQLDHTGKESIVGETKTDKNGAYSFKELNAQYQYYVEFVYNGQYYEPTKHKVSKQNGESTSTSESRGLDFLSDKKSIRSKYYNYNVDIEGRASFNARFEEIASTPNNYETKNGGSGEVYTRDYLKDNGYIDEFGNPTETAPQYVKDCLMSTFTMDDKSGDKLEIKDGDTNPVQRTEDKRNIEYYPKYSRFVLDEMLNSVNQKSLAPDSQNVVISTYTPVYSGVYNIKKINQGYSIRQQADIALSKDVYKVVQEINGKSETYKYNKREAAQEGESCWTVEARNDSGYYNAGYTRELYREDWIYQAEDTVIKDLGGTLKNPKTELEVFVTYRVRIRNLSESLGVRVTELVDYYDSDFTPVLERSFVGDKKENKLQDITIRSDDHYIAESHVTQKNANGNGSIYSNAAENSKNAPSGFKKLYVTGFENLLLDSDDSKDAYIYLTFRVNKTRLNQNSNNGYEYVILDQNIITKEEYARGKDNVVEINGYKTYYGTHTKYSSEEDYGKGSVSPNGEYGPDNIAGIVDRNSKPGNVLYEDEVGKGLQSNGTIVEKNFENDTDNSPSIKIILLNETTVRNMDGIVWKDERTEEEASSKTGNGKKEDSEIGVNNVIVQLVEVLDKNSIREDLRDQLGNDCEYVWKEMKSGDRSTQDSVINVNINGKQLIDSFNVSSDGQYMFKGYIPGKYYVRFIYGTDDKTTGDTENYKVYNGQDYKSTIYHSVYDNGATFDVNNPDNNTAFLSLEDLNNNANNRVIYSYARDTMTTHTPANYAHDFLRRGDYYKSKYLEGTNTLVYPNDAKNYNGGILVAGTRQYVNTYKNGNAEMKNELAQELSDTTPNTFIVAKTALINTEPEYNRTESETSSTGSGNIGTSNNDKSGYYHVSNLSFGLQERPKAQLKATKQVRHVEVKLSNQSILFDAKGRATNVLWINHKAHNPDADNTYEENKNYTNKFMQIPSVRTSKGLIELTMDEEQMHGAQLKLTYLITIANVGEVDYSDNNFYYTGKETNKAQNIVKTRPMQIVDYVGYQTVDDQKTTRNNLRYIASDNEGWTVTTAEELHKDTYKLLSDYAYAGNQDNGNKGANQYTTIVTTEFNNELVPMLVDKEYSSRGNRATDIKGKITDLFKTDNDITCASVVAKTLVLTQTLTADDGGDDKTYNNLMEIVKVNNTVGRRFSDSVVGNQNPTEEPKEVDSDDSQQVRIMPPFGQKYIYYILGGAIAIILIAGIAITIRVTRKK